SIRIAWDSTGCVGPTKVSNRPQRLASARYTRSSNAVLQVQIDDVENVLLLANSIDAPDALLDLGWVPGQIEIYQRACRLQIQAVASGVGADHDLNCAGAPSRRHRLLRGGGPSHRPTRKCRHRRSKTRQTNQTQTWPDADLA